MLINFHQLTEPEETWLHVSLSGERYPLGKHGGAERSLDWVL